MLVHLDSEVSSERSAFGQLLGRVELLERHNRRLRKTGIAIGLVGLVLGGVLGAGRAAAPPVLEARKFVLVGKDGEPLATLGADPFADNAMFTMISRDGRSQIGFTSGGFTIATREKTAVDAKLAPTVRFAANIQDDTELCQLVFQDKTGAIRGFMGIDPEGVTRNYVVDRSGKVGFDATVEGVGTDGDPPTATIRDRSGNFLYRSVIDPKKN